MAGGAGIRAVLLLADDMLHLQVHLLLLGEGRGTYHLRHILLPHQFTLGQGLLLAAFLRLGLLELGHLDQVSVLLLIRPAFGLRLHYLDLVGG